MFNWLKEILELKSQYNERKNGLIICDSCETLKMQLSLANEREQRLLDRLLATPEKPVDSGPVPVTQPNAHIPWRMRQQMLEAEDRRKAQLMREAPKPDPEVEKLEQEIKDAVSGSNA